MIQVQLIFGICIIVLIYIIINNSGYINVTSDEPTSPGQATAFTFGETTESETNATIRTKQTLHTSYVFITNQATPTAQSNTVKITITFKDGTTQTFKYKV